MSNDFIYKITNENPFNDALKEIGIEISNSSDRGIVLICGSALDGLLGEMLATFLVEGEKREEDLFKGKGALQTFDSKITLSYYLGLINKNEFDNLKRLQRVRNIYAHQVVGVSFENDKIRGICSNFVIPKNAFTPRTIPLLNEETKDLPIVDLNPIKNDTHPKDRFIFTFYYLFERLMRSAVLSGFQKRGELTEVLTADKFMEDTIERSEQTQKMYMEKLEIHLKLIDENISILLSKSGKNKNVDKEIFDLEKQRESLIEKIEDFKVTVKFMRELNKLKKYFVEVIRNSKLE